VGSVMLQKEEKMGEFLATLFICYILYIVFFSPVNTNSSSYRLGRGVGNKTRQFGNWLTKD